MTNKVTLSADLPTEGVTFYVKDPLEPYESPDPDDLNLLPLTINLLGETGSTIAPFMSSNHPQSVEVKREIECFADLLASASLGKKPTMIELGSGWALFSLVFRKMFPLGKNVLVDSSLPSITIGEVNFRLNHSILYKNGWEHFSYSSYWGALFGDVDGAAFGDDSNATPDTDFISNPSYPTQQTPFESLDFIEDIIKPEKIDTIGCLHMDIQGSEFPMLTYLDKHHFLKDRIKSLFIATHHIPSHHTAVQLLKNNGFTILQEADRTETAAKCRRRAYENRQEAEKFAQQTNEQVDVMEKDGKTYFLVIDSIIKQFTDGHIFAYKN